MLAAISASDDEGRGRISELNHLVDSIIHKNKIKKSMRSLQDSIISYRKIYFILPKFKEYNKISHPTPSKIPPPTLEECESYLNKLKDLTSDSTGINPESFQKTSKTVEFSLNEINLKEFKENGQHLNSQLINVDFELPLITEISEYSPKDYSNKEMVTNSIIELLKSFIGIQTPEKKVVSSFVNVVMKTKQVKNQTAFKHLYDAFCEFHKLSDEKRNLKYLYKQVTGKINDALIIAREEKNRQQKQKENKESEDIDNKSLEGLANKLTFN